MFKIGDKVVYPLHGAGVIVDVQEKEVLGLSNQYFILQMPLGKIKISVPVDKIDEIGVRAIVSHEQLEGMFDVLNGKKTKMSSNWSQRYRENMEKIKSGDVEEIAVVVRNLSLTEKDKKLSTGEKKMLTSAKKMLITEIAMVKDLEPEKAEEMIDESIRL